VDSVRECAVRMLGEARTPTGWRSWGEALAVELRAAGSATDVVISSRPVVPLTLADYGRGRDNGEVIARGQQRQLLTPW
jgi:hypothetical protein